MGKKQVTYGEKYWYIATTYDGDISVYETDNINMIGDRNRWKLKNYFPDKESAIAMANKLKAVLKGAEVIHVPSGAEILDAAEGHIDACDEEGHPYSDKYDAKAAFVNGAKWLKSKIIK